MGDGIAIPHAHNEAVNEPAVMFAKSQAGLTTTRLTDSLHISSS